MLRKAIRFTDKTIDRVVLLVSLLIFLVCLYAMYDAVNVYYGANDRSVLKYKPHGADDAGVLQELSDDAVAWLTVDDTGIDYPVMQGKNNSAYLNKDPYGNFSLSGSIFLDSRCDGGFNDDYSLLYGHHMDYGAMFGALDDYVKPDFFAAHRTGTLVTVSGKVYSITFFSCMKTLATEKTVFDPVDTNNRELLNLIKKNAIICETLPDPKSKIIALSTCQSAEDIERMIVFGVLKAK